jgi:hypothetical protein
MPVYGGDTPFPLVSDQEAMARVRDAVASRQPFSLIRVADGEAVALSFDESSWLQDVAYLTSHWGGERVPLAAVQQVKDDLEAALRSADVVGVRSDVVNVAMPPDLLDLPTAETAAYVRSHFPLRSNEREILGSTGARRLALLNRVMRQVDWAPQQQLCSHWIHWELLASGALAEILEQVPEVVLVTSKPELEPVVARRFGVRVSVVPVPEKYVDAPVSGAHVPDRYQTVRSELDFPAGTLALVGAGIPGKAYCHWLKESGCVAIDVGSVLDAWIGKASRPLVLAHRFGVTGGTDVPDQLRLRHERPASGRRLTSRWKAGGPPG